MSFSIAPKAGPSLVSESNAPSEAQVSAKARAMAILTGGNNAPAQPTSASDLQTTPRETNTQKDTNEAPASSEKRSEPVSPQLAMLARKEKALRQQAHQVKTEREAMKAKEAEMETRYTQRLQDAEKSWKSRLLEDPVSLMNESGLTYDELTTKLLQGPKQEDLARDNYIKKLETRLIEIETKQNAAAKNFEEQQSSQYKQAISQIRLDATNLVNSDPEFETIKSTKSVEDVVELIEKTFKVDGVLLTVEEASKAVEDYLVAEYDKLSRIGKLQKRIQSKETKQDTGKQSPESLKQSQGNKTLTNNMSTTRALTPRERAVLAFEGRLKS